MYLEFSLPADGLDGIVLGTLVIPTGGTVLGAAEVIGHHILRLNFLNGKVDGSIYIVQGTVLLLLVDAIEATQFAQADDLVVLVVQLLEQVEGLAVLAGAQGLGTDDLALVQFAHHHLGHGAVLQIIGAGGILGLAQAGNRFIQKT